MKPNELLSSLITFLILLSTCSILASSTNENLAWISVLILSHNSIQRIIKVNGILNINTSGYVPIMDNQVMLMRIRVENVTIESISYAQVKIEDKNDLLLISYNSSPVILVKGKGTVSLSIDYYLILDSFKVRISRQRSYYQASFFLNQDYIKKEGMKRLLMVVGFPTPTNLVITKIYNEYENLTSYILDKLIEYTFNSLVILDVEKLPRGTYTILLEDIGVYLPKEYDLYISWEVINNQSLLLVPYDEYLELKLANHLSVINILYLPYSASLQIKGKGYIIFEKIIKDHILLRNMKVLARGNVLKLRALESKEPIYARINLTLSSLAPIGSLKGDSFSVVRYPLYNILQGEGEVVYASPFIMIIKGFKVNRKSPSYILFSLEPVTSRNVPIKNALIKVEIYNMSGSSPILYKRIIYKGSPLRTLRLNLNSVVNVTVYIGNSEVLHTTIINPPTIVPLRCSVYDITLTVTDSRGNYLHNTNLELFTLPGRQLFYSNRSTSSLYNIWNVPIGKYEVRVYWREKLVYHGILYISKSENYVLKCNIFSLAIRLFTKDLEVLEGAEVYIKDFNNFTFKSISNGSGIALFPQIPIGKYKVIIRWKDTEVYVGNLEVNSSHPSLFSYVTNVRALNVLITDAYGNPIEGAKVSLHTNNVTLIKISDVTGIVKFGKLPIKKYRLQVELGSYSLSKEISLDTSGEIRLTLPIILHIGSLVLTINDLYVIIPIILIILALSLIVVFYKVRQRRSIVIE